MSLRSRNTPTYQLVTLTGTHQGQAYPITGRLTVGSAHGNSVQLEHDTLVKPAHAQVELAPDGSLWVKNLAGGSTMVNGTPVDRQQLIEGARIRIGGTDLIVERVPGLPGSVDLGASPLSKETPPPILLWQAEDIDGRYRLTDKLASGGMGDVFKAIHVDLRKTVAVKVMRRELGNAPDFVERFKREAMVCSAIGQHNIVDISDFGRTSDGRFYFVMEYLEGQTLGALLKAESRLSNTRAVHICLQIARALAAAHSRGIVHRDLKPENVIILQREDHPDFVKVLDFGVAKVSDEPAKINTTGVGTLMGTPQYMSPEQASALAVDARSDIYSLGLILYELVTGRPVFDGATPSIVIAAQIHTPPPPMTPAEGAPPIPSQLEALVMRTLRKKPDDRPQSMAEVITQLERVLHEPFDEPLPPVEREVPRSRAPMVLLAVVMILGAAGATGWSMRPKPATVPAMATNVLPVRVAAEEKTQPTPEAPPPAVVEQALPPAPVPTVKLTIDSRPSGAVVLEGESIIGTTPMTVDWVEGRSAQLILRRDGFVPATRQIAPLSDLSLMVELQAPPRRVAPPPVAPQPKRPVDNLKDVPYEPEE